MDDKRNLEYKLSLKDVGFNKTMLNAMGHVASMDSKMSNLSGGGLTKSIIGANLLTNAIQSAGSAIIDFGKSAIQSYGRQEQFLVSLKTMFHGNVMEAELLNNQLKNFAKETPFELQEVQDATKMMIAYGSNSSSVVEEMRMLGDVSSGVGSSLSEIGYLYGTLRTQGRATAIDIRQFAGRGIPIYEELAKVLGVNKKAVSGLVTEGKVGFKEVEKAFQNMTHEGGLFFNMMKEQSGTLNGKISNMADAWDQLKTSIAGSQSGILKDTVEWITKMIGVVSDGWNQMNTITGRLQKGGYKGKTDLLSGMGLFDPSAHIKNMDNMALSGALDAKTGRAGKSTKDALNEKVSIMKMMGVDTGLFQQGKLGADDYNRRIALQKSALQEVESMIGIRKKNDMKMGEDGEGGKKGKGGSAASLGTTTEVSSARPQNLVINIHDGLVKQLNIYATTLKESGSKVREEVAKVLLEVVNDANISART